MWSKNLPNVYKVWGRRPRRWKSNPIWGQRDLHIPCFLFQDQISPFQYLLHLILYEFLFGSLSVCPSLRPSVTVFLTFLLHTLTCRAEILCVTFFLWTFDQVRVSKSYVPFTCKFPMVMHFVLILHKRCRSKTNFYVFSYDKTSLKLRALVSNFSSQYSWRNSKISVIWSMWEEE